jgi:ribosomal protein S18 acetylase RimI-like enzyme
LSSADNYIVRLDERSNVIGVVEVKVVQWYQSEICHVSVSSSALRQGIGVWLITQAEEKAEQQNARIVQCTIRSDNVQSIGLFTKMKYSHVCSFYDHISKNTVLVWQKVISPIK